MQSRGGGFLGAGLAKASGIDGEVLKTRTIHRGARVMLVRNLSPTLVNGSIGTVVDFVEPSPETAPHGAYQRAASSRPNVKGLLPLVRFDHNEQVCIPLISVPLTGTAQSHFVNFSVDVMPLVPAFAFTVHKVQGITVNAAQVVLDMQRSWRCDHLVYVAASRIRRLDQLHILNLSPEHLSVNDRALRFARSLPSALAMSTVFRDNQPSPSRWSSDLSSRFGSLSRFRRALRLNRAAWALPLCE
jgi:ATP-dependent exoDNAse (exonuclease V) alpha subunit